MIGVAGQAQTLSAMFRDASGIVTNPTSVELDITRPDGSILVVSKNELTNSSTGVFSYTLVPNVEGRWVYVFRSSGSVEAATPGSIIVTANDWAPSVADVGRMLPARTADINGNELGAFTTTTRPTAAQVESIIAEEVGALAGFIGNNFSSTLFALAHSASLYRIAARIELDYWPEQVQLGRSSYEQLAAMRDSEAGRLISAVRSTSAAGDAGSTAIGSILTRSQAAIDSAAIFGLDQVANGPDLAPTAPTPTGWPIVDPYWGGGAGSQV